ncbi:MAG: PDZ domain-containing protein [Clostridia bacterium]|nr:PDZ domain-containing protein [Clostridia bacterium]
MTVRRGLRYGMLLLAAVLVVTGLYHGLRREETLPLTDSSAAAGLMLLDDAQGVYVLAIMDQSPAYWAGIEPGDYILEAEGVALEDVVQLDEMMSQGYHSLRLKLLRDGEGLQVTLSAR